MALTKVKEAAVLSYCYTEQAKQKYVSTYCSFQCIDCKQLICNGGKCYGKKQSSPCLGYTNKPIVKANKIEANDIAKDSNGNLCYVTRVVGDRCQVAQDYKTKWYHLDSLTLYKSHTECSWGKKNHKRNDFVKERNVKEGLYYRDSRTYEILKCDMSTRSFHHFVNKYNVCIKRPKYDVYRNVTSEKIINEFEESIKGKLRKFVDEPCIYGQNEIMKFNTIYK